MLSIKVRFVIIIIIRGVLFLTLLLLRFLARLLFLALLLMSVQSFKHVLLHKDALHAQVQVLARLHIVHEPVVLDGLGIEGGEILQGLVGGFLPVPVD